MHLNHTEAYLHQKSAEGWLDTYAVLAGVQGREQRIASPNANGDTYFDIASCGKVLVTSTLILQAVGEGKIGLDDRLERFFANVPEEKKPITIRQLLTHTSGIVRVLFPEDVAHAGHDAIASFILSTPLAYSPGTNYIYSCNGFMLLGFILERLYGEQLDAIFEKRLKRPLGLTRSRYNIAIDEPNAAVCYERKDVGSLRVDDINVYNMGGVAGAGGLFWTLNDMEKFVKAVLRKDPALYAEQLFALAVKDYTPDFQEGRGLGYLIVDERYPQTGKLFPKGSFGHTGWTGTSFFLHRSSGLYAIVLTNITRFTSIKSGFTRADSEMTHRLRAEIHNSIYCDLLEQCLV